MKLMKVLLPLLITVRPLLAATEFDGSIPIDTFTAFLVRPDLAPPTYFQDMPAGFPFVLPQDFILRGSLERFGAPQLILQTTQDRNTAEQSLLDSLLATGWQQVDLNNSGVGGFIRTPALPTVFELCHETLGMRVQFNVSPSNTYSTAHLIYGRGMPAAFPTCASMPTSPRSVFAPDTDGIDMYMPKLVLPELLDADLGYRLAAGGGGSRDDYRIDVSVDSNWTTAELFSYLAAQLSAQDWISQPELVDEFFAMGSWQKVAQGNTRFRGILSIVKKADTKFDLSFRLLRSEDNVSGVASDER